MLRIYICKETFGNSSGEIQNVTKKIYPFRHSVWKSPKMSHLSFYHFGILYQFLSDFMDFIIDLSGNTVLLQASGFQKPAKMDHFWHFYWTFVHSKCKRSSLRSQCWMRLFGRISNSVDRTVNFHLSMISQHAN